MKAPTNHEIAKLLRDVAAAYSIQDEKKFRFQIIAYQKAADTIDTSHTQIADLYKEQKLDGLAGIGSSIKAHLSELIQTGRVKHFDTILESVPASVFPLLDIPSLGPKKAFKLVSAFSLKDPKTVIDDIEKKATEGKIASLDSFGEKSQSDILRVIKEFRKGAGKTTRMLIPFASELADNLVAYLKKSPAIKEVSPLGSLRRRKPTIGDVDVAVATDDPQKALDYFVAYPYKQRIIERGPMSSSFLTSGGHQVDLMTQPVASFGSLLQHFTGSKQHNVHLRDYALKKGLSLSEKGIKHLKEKGQPMATYKTEEAFYKDLGMDWVPPEMREDTGEIQLAIEHKLPKLIELSDMKGDLHIHSNYPLEPSHDLGTHSMQEMLDKAKKLKYTYLGFSEHNPSVSKHTKQQIYSILKTRHEFIEKLKSNNKTIRIINLLEVDILASGEIAIDEACGAYLDGFLVSIHSAFNMDKATMTKRVLNALSHPKAKILSHPTGRLINERPGYELDWDKVFAFCKEHNKALEINAWPNRTDLPDVLIREAIAHGVKLVIDTDSHATDHMDVMKYGVWNARRGWATKDAILNTLEYNKFIAWLKE